MKKNKNLSNSIWIWQLLKNILNIMLTNTKNLIKKHKFAMPLCKHIDENKLNNAIKTTSNIPAGYYITAECIKDVEKFAQKYMKNLVTKMVLSVQTKLLLRFSCMILNIFKQIYIIHIFSLND